MNPKIHLKVVYGILGLLFILVLLALFFAVPDIKCESLSFSLDKVATLLGIIISAVGLVITVFFVILATEAYFHVKKTRESLEDFQRKKSQFDDQLDDLLQRHSESKKDLDDFHKKKSQFDIQSNDLLQRNSESLCENLEALIALADLSRSKKLRNKLVLEQARLSYRYPMRDKDVRLALLKKIEAIGEEEDIFNIQKNIIDNSDEDEEIKDCARTVLQELKQRLNNNNVNKVG